MLVEWASKYSQAASGSRKSSQFGAFFIVVIAMIESFYLIRGTATAENLSVASVVTGAIPIGLFLSVFSLRFALLFRFASSLIARAITWWLIVLVVYICLEFYGPEPGVIYDLFHSFPLQVSGTLFVLIGIIRFAYFSAASFKK